MPKTRGFAQVCLVSNPIRLVNVTSRIKLDFQYTSRDLKLSKILETTGSRAAFFNYTNRYLLTHKKDKLLPVKWTDCLTR